jgi:hypothetical protein
MWREGAGVLPRRRRKGEVSSGGLFGGGQPVSIGGGGGLVGKKKEMGFKNLFRESFGLACGAHVHLSKCPLFLPRHPDRWARDVRTRFNSYLDSDFLELQKTS